MREKMRAHRNKFIALGVCLLAGLVLLLWILETEGPQSGLDMAARDENDYGIAPDTGFVLSLKTPLESMDDLKRDLTFVPGNAFSVAPGDGAGVYIITPLRVFEPGAEVTAHYGNQTARFTVRQQLVVTGTLPEDGATQVHLQSGIEFTLNTSTLKREQFRRAFSISPEVPGKFTSGAGRYTFYPTDGYAPDTTYTVTLAGLENDDGATLSAPLSFQFTTTWDSGVDESRYALQMYGNGVSTNTLTGEAPVFRAYAGDQLPFDEGTAVSATVSAFDGWESYAGELERSIATAASPVVAADRSRVRELAKYTLNPVSGFSPDGYTPSSWYLELPEALPEGWYLVDLAFDAGDRKIEHQHLLQVSPYSVFFMWSDANMLAWVNDSATGQPVPGAQISLDGGVSAAAVTDADGAAQANDAIPPTDPESRKYGTLLTVDTGAGVFVDVNTFYYYGENDYYYGTTKASRRYISYLYTDRPLYRTTDTIEVWGVARSRDLGATAAPTGGILKLATYGENSLAEVDCQIGADGTFTAQLPIEKLQGANWCGVELWVGDVRLASQWVTVRDFVKPVHTATTAPEQPVYLAGGETEIGIGTTVAMFDGTPATRFGLKLTDNAETFMIEQADLKTNEEGHAGAALKLRADKDSWYPVSYWYSYSGTDPQAEPLSLYGTFNVIHRDLMLRGERVEGAGGQSVRVAANAIDISGITDKSQLWDVENLRGAPVAAQVNATLYHVYYEKKVRGTSYDYVNRVTQELYSYERKEDPVETFAFTTEGGEYRLDGLPEGDRDNSYFLRLESSDSLGRRVETTVYLGALYERWGYRSGGGIYELQKDTGPDDLLYNDYEGVRHYYWYTGSRFADGEDAGFTLYNGDEAVPAGSGRILYTVVQDDFSGTAVQAVGGVTIPFGEKLVPNYVLTGAYFDGKRTHTLQDTRMSFDASDRALTISLTAGAESYAPGGRVTVEAAVTDTAGRPAEDVALVLGVVDEALFALQEQYVDILASIYADIYFPNIQRYVSEVPMMDAAGGEKGGGGGDGSNIRTDFEDTAQFLTATTGEGGRAVFTFTLPDNITTWRLTALGIDPAGRAGNTAGQAVATKPFFVTPVTNDALQTGDSCAVGLYAAGTGVGSDEVATYTIRLQGPGVDETRTAVSPIRKYASVDFGALAGAGEYTLTVSGKCGGHTDAVELPVVVQPSLLEVSIIDSFTLKDGLYVEPLRWPVSAVFYGEGGKTYSQVLRNLQWNSGGARADMRLARAYVAGLLEGRGGWYGAAALDEDLADIDGRTLLRLLPYDGYDLELSLLARLAAPDLVSADFLKDFTPAGYDGELSVGLMYLAQVMAGQQPEVDLYALATGPAAPDLLNNIYLAMALYQSGDAAGAQKLYDELVLPRLAKTTGVSGDMLWRVDSGDRMGDENRTAAASMLATMLKTDEAPGLALQLAEKKSKYEPYLLQQVYYLTVYGPEAGGGGKFTYKRDGKTVEVALDGGLEAITFTAAQWDEAAFKATGGKVYADVYYTGGPHQLDVESEANRIGLVKTVEPMTGGTLEPGQLVKITITPDFSGLDTTVGLRTLMVDDVIPAGLRYEAFPDGADYTYSLNPEGWNLASRQGQRLQFAVYGLNTKGQWLKPIVYYARVATPGTYVVESAYISSTGADSWGLSERGEVKFG